MGEEMKTLEKEHEEDVKMMNSRAAGSQRLRKREARQRELQEAEQRRQEAERQADIDALCEIIRTQNKTKIWSRHAQRLREYAEDTKETVENILTKFPNAEALYDALKDYGPIGEPGIFKFHSKSLYGYIARRNQFSLADVKRMSQQMKSTDEKSGK